MADITPDTIVVKFNDTANQWVAHFRMAPQVAFGAEFPVAAIRRLLECTEAEPDRYPLACDQDRAGSFVLLREIIWQPLEILFPCQTCNGTGKYVGLLEVGPCKICGGRKVVPG